MKTNSLHRIIILLFFISGFCNLVYEIVWARMFNLVFGVTVFAISAVLASFMLGLAIGGIVMGRLSQKISDTIGLFSLLHCGIFLSTVFILWIFPVFKDLYLNIYKILHPNFYLFRTMLFFFSVLVMIVPTTLMGATFPVACSIVARHNEHRGKDIGIVYSANTFGSVIGCIVTIFFLLGSAGMSGSIYVAASMDLIIGLFGLMLRKVPFQDIQNP